MLNIKDLRVGNVIINKEDRSVHIVCIDTLSNNNNNCQIMTDKTIIPSELIDNYEICDVKTFLNNKVSNCGDFVRVDNHFGKKSQIISFDVNVSVRYNGSYNTSISIGINVRFSDSKQYSHTANYNNNYTVKQFHTELNNRELTSALEIMIIEYMLDSFRCDSQNEYNNV